VARALTIGAGYPRAVPRVVLCVSIDCECDKGPRWRTRRPLRFEGIRRAVVEQIHPVLSDRGAKPTYLLSPEVVRDEASVGSLSGLRGCELGTHLHGEMANPGAFTPEVTQVLQRDYSREREHAKVSSLTASFRTAFGYSPRSFRAGRFGIGPNTVPILEDLGYVVDSSVTPGVDWSDLSPGLSFVGAPSQPYHPDARDPSKPGASRLLEVPVTTVKRALSALPWVGRLAEPRWLRPTRSPGRTLVAVARSAVRLSLSEQPRRTVVLNAMFHNVEVVAGASPYAATDDAARAILARLAALLDWAKREGIATLGLADVPDALGSSERDATVA
jgi:hypothetical protein